MELKDVILSTLAEMDEQGIEPERETAVHRSTTPAQQVDTPAQSTSVASNRFSNMDLHEAFEDECRFLESVKERLLVLFEGFQSPNNTHIEAKVDLTLNFLEYLLATIDSRVENLKKSGR